MGMCCVKMMMIGWRNAWSMKLRVQGQEEDQRGPGERFVRENYQARKLNKEDAMDRCKWRKMIKDVRWSGWVWVGECFFWYRPTRVVPDKRPLNGCVCVCFLVHLPAITFCWCLLLFFFGGGLHGYFLLTLINSWVCYCLYKDVVNYVKSQYVVLILTSKVQCSLCVYKNAYDVWQNEQP